jgi:hypothetical protein
MAGTTSRSASIGQPTRVLAILGAVSVVQVLLVLMFAWSSSRAAPNGVPIAVAGPAQATAAIAHGLDASRPGAFDVSILDDDAAARTAVTDRQVYASLSLSGSGATLYTAAAASPAIAQLLSQALPAAFQQANPGAQLTVTDLVPNPTDDPNGAGLTVSLIPIAITSIAAGALLGLLVRDRRARLLGVLGYAVAAGLLSGLALQSVLGVLTGSWLANAATLALASLAISAASAALVAALGLAGIGLAAFVIFFFGFSFSGVTSAWQLVPTPWGRIAQYLPVGATNTSLRSVAFFDAAASGPSLLVLGTWAVLGLAVLVGVPGRRSPN